MIKYRGGKAREIPYLISYIPDNFGRYVEPFFGGGSMYFHLEPDLAVINDINKRLMSFYKGVRDDFDRVRQELEQIESIYKQNRLEYERLKGLNPKTKVPDMNEQLYYKLRDMYNGKIHNYYSDATLYYFINKTAYSGMIRYNSKGEYNVPYGRYKSINASNVTYEHHKLLNKSKITCGEYSTVFDMTTNDDFMFLDPPYDCVFSDYGNDKYSDGFNEDEHRKLANDFINIGCRALMVIGETPLTKELYQGKVRGSYDKNYSVNIRNRFKATATHLIVTNYT